MRAILKAVDDVNAMIPQPDFVLYGGDLAQLGQPGELGEGAQILKALKAEVHMMVGEHDWYLDMGEKWRALFGQDIYSFDHKGVHFVVLNSVIVEDYWTAPKLTPMERMLAMAQLDNPNGRPFTVGDAQRDWLKNDLAKLKPETPIIVFSHSPLYKIYKAGTSGPTTPSRCRRSCAPFKNVTVIHGHTHQMLSNRIGNIHFHGMLSTAWPWPYAPAGPAEAHGAHEPRRSLRRARRLRRRLRRRAQGRPRRQAATTCGAATRCKVSAAYLGSDGASRPPASESDVNY